MISNAARGAFVPFSFVLVFIEFNKQKPFVIAIMPTIIGGFRLYEFASDYE